MSYNLIFHLIYNDYISINSYIQSANIQWLIIIQKERECEYGF